MNLHHDVHHLHHHQFLLSSTLASATMSALQLRAPQQISVMRLGELCNLLGMRVHSFNLRAWLIVSEAYAFGEAIIVRTSRIRPRAVRLMLPHVLLNYTSYLPAASADAQSRSCSRLTISSSRLSQRWPEAIRCGSIILPPTIAIHIRLYSSLLNTDWLCWSYLGLPHGVLA